MSEGAVLDAGVIEAAALIGLEGQMGKFVSMRRFVVSVQLLWSLTGRGFRQMPSCRKLPQVKLSPRQMFQMFQMFQISAAQTSVPQGQSSTVLRSQY